MNVGPSKLLPCPICKKQIRARGMDAHMRLMHGTRVSNYKAKERPTQLELGIGATESISTPQNAVKTGWKHKRRKSKKVYYNEEQGSTLLETLVVGLGVAWVIAEIAKHMQNQTAGKQEKSFLGSQGKAN
jgi:hypothetical protein